MPSPVAIVAEERVACAAVAWRFRGRLQLTVVVKATFAIVPGGVATVAAPREILHEERTFDRHPSRSVEAASNLAPYLARCDVIFTGHACAPGGQPVPAGSVRIGLARESQRLLDKTLHVFGDRASADAPPAPFTRMPLVYERALGGPGEPNLLGVETPNIVDAVDSGRAGGFGPVSRYWPVRKRLLGKINRAALDSAIAQVPEAMPWEYFQAAPPDQQIDYLQGGEWLVLDGIHPAHPRVQTRIPAARGAARVVAGPGAAPLPVDLSADTLAIDGDGLSMTLVWRGRWEVPGDEQALASVRVLAGLEGAGTPVDWTKLATLATAAPAEAGLGAPSARGAPAEAAGEGTMAVSDVVGRKPVTPFGPAQPGAAQLDAAPASAAATPWGSSELRAPPAAIPGEATLAGAAGSRLEAAGESTLGLRPDQQSAARERPVAPFALTQEELRSSAATSTGEPPRSGPIAGAPWSGLAAPAPPVLPAGESTMALGHPRPLPPVAPPPPVVAPPPIVAPPPMVAPPPIAPPPPAAPPVAAPPPIAPPPIATARQPPKRAPAPKDPEALASQLQAAGASSDDVAALMRALRPPPPPPPPEEE